jgi:hypothetical protein
MYGVRAQKITLDTDNMNRLNMNDLSLIYFVYAGNMKAAPLAERRLRPPIGRAAGARRGAVFGAGAAALSGPPEKLCEGLAAIGVGPGCSNTRVPLK